jgi:hypothetical protein
MREQIFNPFVTTKNSGVGLGLSIVSKIVDEHHGTMELASGTAGARFVLFFPLAEQSSGATARSSTESDTGVIPSPPRRARNPSSVLPTR